VGVRQVAQPELHLGTDIDHDIDRLVAIGRHEEKAPGRGVVKR
jgi:hypothetical protein